MRNKKAKAIRRLVYRGESSRMEDRKYVAQRHLIKLKDAPELNYERFTILATGLRRVYLDVKRTLKAERKAA